MKNYLTLIAAVILAEFTERDIGEKQELRLLINPERFVSNYFIINDFRLANRFL